ncbi:VOC family protein [Winogradskyella flava]|uniref:VOC family protein n=1 Tax=Winogradskyella flava TaxID=1884876 RepID=UPI001C8D7FA7|nr:VOC family protein [Winogradskyella flava]
MKKFISLIVLIVLFNCNNKSLNEELDNLRSENYELKKEVDKAIADSKRQITTFLTFQNKDAEQAMNFYVSIFKNSKITEVRRHGKESPAPEGSILMARFELNGSQYACSDSYIKHEWNFTPGVSNFVDCASNEELESLFTKLSENGKVLMPLADYGFSKKFGFIEDQFGVSWQLNLDE